MLKNRLITAVCLIPAFLAALFYLSDIVWALLIFAISMIGLHEWAILNGFERRFKLIYLIATVLIGVLVLGYGSKYGEHAFFDLTLYLAILVLAFWVLLIPIWLYKKMKLNQTWLLALLGWFLVFPLWMALVCLKLANPWLLLALFVLIWIADSAAYFAGRVFGKHKLAPTISPGKTWEGVLGAVIAVMCYAMMLSQYLGAKTWLVCLGAMLILGLSIVGDLFESLIKRQANMKDSGTLLPGHGGVLDRVDSLIPTMPIALLFVYCNFHQFQYVV